MATDWIVVGNGLAGAALSYELQKQGLSVLLLEQFAQSAHSATRYSYGGIAYWSGQDQLMRQLCQEGIDLHRQLSAELEGNTEFRDWQLLLTIASGRDPAAVAANYAQMAIQPIVLDPKTACEIEPLLNPAAIAGVLQLPHGHVSPEATVAAYNRAFLRLGGQIEAVAVTGLVKQGRQIEGVITDKSSYKAAQTAVCTGALTRLLLSGLGKPIQLYFSQAELIETEAVSFQMQTMIMPAELQRFELEAKAGAAEVEAQWNQPGQELVPAVLDAGVVQLRDGRLRIGQISRANSDLEPAVDRAASEQILRQGIGEILPSLQSIPGRWCSCQVAFSGDRLPLVGPMLDWEGLYLFSGFSNPFAILPPLARRFAQAAACTDAPVADLSSDAILAQLSLERFRA
jgi:glycine/D-amino acid oxidase-like deaminating enzyme